MIIKFISAKQLNKQFTVLGNFYNRKINKKINIYCRNILEIISYNIYPIIIKNINNTLPNAIVIMMNPGSSKPLLDIDNQKELNKNEKIKQNLVLTKPDITQYQIMRIMYYLKWDHVRIINLSDLCEAKSLLFIKKYLYLENKLNYDLHSIFSPKRKNELINVLNRKNNTPIINAWGINKKLNNLIRRTEKSLSFEKKIFGIKKSNITPIKYFHPLPMLQKNKNIWLKNIIKQLNL